MTHWHQIHDRMIYHDSRQPQWKCVQLKMENKKYVKNFYKKDKTMASTRSRLYVGINFSAELKLSYTDLLNPCCFDEIR